MPFQEGKAGSLFCPRMTKDDGEHWTDRLCGQLFFVYFSLLLPGPWEISPGIKMRFSMMRNFSGLIIWIPVTKVWKCVTGIAVRDWQEGFFPSLHLPMRDGFRVRQGGNSGKRHFSPPCTSPSGMGGRRSRSGSPLFVNRIRY